MPTPRESLALSHEYVVNRLEQWEQQVRSLTAVILPGSERRSVWEIANTVCDRYSVPQGHGAYTPQMAQ